MKVVHFGRGLMTQPVCQSGDMPTASCCTRTKPRIRRGGGHNNLI